MSLYGAFFSGLTGMNAQSASIAISSDNITNNNTIGYKAGEAHFATLITQSSGNNSYSSGGVELVHRKVVDKQGMVQSTGVVSDIAVSGKGMLVVNSKNDASGEYLFTRAGSFRQDSLGNFVNAAGMTLMAWPLDNEQRIPGSPGNLNTVSSALLASLEPVNLRSVSNAVAATTIVKFSLNLKSSEKILEGAGQTAQVISTSLENASIGLDDVIIPNANVREGGTIKIFDGINNYTYEYGGVSYTNNVALGIMGATNVNQVFNTGVTTGDKFTITNTQLGTLTFTFSATNPDTTNGFFNNITTLAEAINDAAGLTARIYGGRLYVAAEDANQALTFANVGAATLVGSLGFFNVAATGSNLTNDGVITSDDITAVAMFGQNTTAGVFVGPANGDTMTITTPSLGAVTVTYQNPPVLATDFNSLATLATAINSIAGLSASISNNRLSIISDTPTDTVTLGFAGTDFPTNLNLYDIASIAGSRTRFATLADLQTKINATTTIYAKSTTSGLSNASLKIYNIDPLGTMTYDYTYPLPGSGNLLTEFGMTRNAQVLTTATDFAKGTVTGTATGPAYDPLAVTAGNMAGGLVTPQYSRNFEVYDPLGTRHDFRISFVKVNVNRWAVEVYALTPTEIVSSSGRTDGLVAYGNVIFNGDGSLRDVSPALLNPINLVWTNGALNSGISLSLGTAGLPAGTIGATQIGKRDGLSQIDSDYNVQFVDQNGVSAALLSSIDIDGDGFIIANYRNGLSQKLYKIPLADFQNFNGLEARDGNVYANNQEAGPYNLREPNTGGVGLIKSSALEQANVELSEELTKLVVAQRGYEADTQIIRTVNELLRELNRLFS